MANRWRKNGNSDRLYFLWLQNSCSDCSHEIKTHAPWKKSYDKPRKCVKKQTQYFANKGLYGQSCGFCSSCVRMWQLDHKEGWAPKNLSFQIVELEKTMRVPGTARRSTQSILKEISPEYSLEEQMLIQNSIKLQYFGRLVRRANSLEKILILGKTEGRKRRGWQRTR